MTTDNEQKIKLLIVDDNLATLDNLKKMLYFESEVEVVDTALNADQAIAKTRQLLPDVVLMDVNMPGVDGIAATRLVREVVPDQTVVVMSVQREAEYVRRAMIAGASDYLAKPFGSADLVNSLKQVLAARRTPPAEGKTREPSREFPDGSEEKPRGRVIAVFSPKGGLGRTTVAVNLATALREETGMEVAIADLSMVFGDVGAMLDLQGRSVNDLLDHADTLDSPIIDQVLVRHSSGIRALLAPPRPELAELVTGDHVTKIISKMRDMFDFVILDTMPSFHDVTLAALDAADEIIVLATLELLVLKNIRGFLEIAESLGYQSKKITIAVNRVNGSAGISQQDVEMFLQQKVAATIVSDWKLASFAQNCGVPFVISNRKSAISADLFALASMVSLGSAKPLPTRAEPAKPRQKGFPAVTKHLIPRPA